METRVTLKPSQWVNILWFIIAWAAVIFGIGLYQYWMLIFTIPWIWKALELEFWRFQIDNETDSIIERKGVFSVKTVEVKYFRIKSVRIMKPFFLRIFGLSTVEIVTSEPFQPYLRVYAIRNGDEWVQFFKENAIYWRDELGVRETDFHHF